MEIKDTVVLKEMDEFIRAMHNAMTKDSMIFHAFLVTCPVPNLNIVMRMEDEKFFELRKELSVIVDKSYSKSKMEMDVEFGEVTYTFSRFNPSPTGLKTPKTRSKSK